MVSLLIAVVLMAIVFDYINGFHDAANAIATVVSTGVLPIRTAVFLAGILNFLGAITGTAVAKTIATGFADPSTVTQAVVLAALIGASTWNIITWWFGIPSSSSHALVGGLAGAVVAHSGLSAFKWGALVQKVLVPLVASPTIGFVVAFFTMVGLMWIARGHWKRPVLMGLWAVAFVVLIWALWNGPAIGLALSRSTLETRIVLGLGVAFLIAVPVLYGARPSIVQAHSRRLQLLSAAMMAFGHGSNDAQKSMGIITLALVAFMTNGHAQPEWMPAWVMPADADHVPTWVIFSCALAIALGTAAGGTRIIKTMGTKIIRITPIQGFAAETAGALTILGASHLGIPVSTTHVINASIMGVGASRRVSAVRWGVAGNILIAWVVTLPFSAGLAFVTMKILAFFGA
ncbi:MAG: inorganic phosphate transporter [Archangium sp.]|nr:inorganic phosphate transporter [Archangium sp.]MDP3154867.1 inorganic phosphate transporter [Archangium sp.]MDP3575986.1 inorganic phosphate transporter [Archangium sp.]